jgi:hypothetical protein
MERDYFLRILSSEYVNICSLQYYDDKNIFNK